MMLMRTVPSNFIWCIVISNKEYKSKYKPKYINGGSVNYLWMKNIYDAGFFSHTHDGRLSRF